MNGRIGCLVVALVSFVIVHGTVSAGEVDTTPLRLGCVGFSKDVTAKAFRELGTYLESKVGSKVTVTVYPKYNEVIHDLVNEKIDMAMLSPLVYLNARSSCQVSTLGVGVYRATGDFAYRSIILAPKGAGIKSLSDLRGKSVAFVDLLSASGFVVPKAAMVSAGVDVRGTFYGNHIDAVGALVEGKADAACTMSTIFDDSREIAAHRGELDTVWTSEFVIPGDVFVATPSLSSSLSKKIEEALLAYGSAQQKGRAQQNALYKGFEPEQEKLFTGLEEFLNSFLD